MKNQNLSYVDMQVLAQTGGMTMVDYFHIVGGLYLGITDEVVVLSYNEYDDVDYIGNIGISEYGNHNDIQYPEPTAHDRVIGDENPNLTGWYIKKHKVETDDGIVYYDLIEMRNGITITIDGILICVYKSLTDAKNRKEPIGFIEIPN